MKDLNIQYIIGYDCEKIPTSFYTNKRSYIDGDRSSLIILNSIKIQFINNLKIEVISMLNSFKVIDNYIDNYGNIIKETDISGEFIFEDMNCNEKSSTMPRHILGLIIEAGETDRDTYVIDCKSEDYKSIEKRLHADMNTISRLSKYSTKLYNMFGDQNLS